MIIQCQRCLTKFRFDDALMSGEGVWVRCSRCRQVFFEENPEAAGAAGTEPARFYPPEPEAPGFPRDGGPEDTDIGIDARPDDLVPIDAENGPPIEKDIDAPHASAPEYGESPDEPDTSETDGEPGDEDAPAAPPRRKRRGWIWALVFILILALGGGAFCWLYPEAGRQARDAALKALRPVTGLFPGAATKDQSMDLKTLAIQDVRQRIVNNWLVGDIRIVEGSVVNRAPHAATEIRVRARHYDAAGAVLAEQTAFCGNFLTEEELGTLPEAEIQLELAHPRGSDVSNEKIEPGGQIPFMVVFVRPPAQVARTTVAIAGADRLLP